MLLDDIITILGNEQSHLTDALLKTKILLHQIGQKDLARWVDNELNGYPDGSIVPEYRIVPSQVLANFSNVVLRYTRHPIPIGHLKPKERETLTKTHMRQSLSVLEQLVSSAGNEQLRRTIPLELNKVLGVQLDSSFHIEHAWCTISSHDVKRICTKVRSRLLDFIL
jgi:AbiTii